MQAPKAVSPKEMPLGIDAETVEEYAFQSKLLKEFIDVPNIEKAWTFKSQDGNGSQAMFSISQASLLTNKKRKFVLSSLISRDTNHSVNFQWSPFPIEMTGVSAVIPSPSGTKLLVVRNKESDSPTCLEIWGPSQLQKEIHIPLSIHGSIYTDGWFEGFSWNNEESLIAYVAEEPSPSKPMFSDLGFKMDGSTDEDFGNWKGQGEWKENWGETYSEKGKPSLFMFNVRSGKVQAVKGIDKSLSVGQVVWAPSATDAAQNFLIFVGWSPEKGSSRKLGIKYCYNRSCALYAVTTCSEEPNSDKSNHIEATGYPTESVKLTEGLNSALFPRFSLDGKFLVFLSAKCAVDSGAHSATSSLHRMDWPADGKPFSPTRIIDVVPAVMSPEDGCFPGLYCTSILNHPWLPDGHTMVLSSCWGSMEVILSVDILSFKVSRITPADSTWSWNVLAINGDIIAVCSSPINPPQIKYGYLVDKSLSFGCHWLDISNPFMEYSEKVKSLLSKHQFNILKIPVTYSEALPKGAQKPLEAIFLSSSNSHTKEQLQVDQRIDNECNPLIVVLHGGPHSVFTTCYSKSHAFLVSLGFNMLIVNYRGSVGFGEEALQSLLGKIGSQDVGDVLTALNYAFEKKLADPSKVAVLGGSHGGFLTTHLIGQAPDKFAVAAVRNPVCNLSLMVGTTDIPDWCYVETYGKDGKDYFTEAPSSNHLLDLHSKSPISHLAKVRSPVLFLLGAQDLRVPISNGLQYARALKEKGVKTKVIVFPNDVHSIDRPQSDFESFLNIGVWFKKYCK